MTKQIVYVKLIYPYLASKAVQDAFAGDETQADALYLKIIATPKTNWLWTALIEDFANLRELVVWDFEPRFHHLDPQLVRCFNIQYLDLDQTVPSA